MTIESYIEKYPVIWEKFKQYTLEAAANGRTRFSARTVVERLRWDTMLSENGSDYKINNNIAPKLARHMMKTYPGLQGFFQVRG